MKQNVLKIKNFELKTFEVVTYNNKKTFKTSSLIVQLK